MSYSALTPRYYGYGAAVSASSMQSLSTLLPTKSQVASDLQPYVDIANSVSPPPGFDPTNPETWKPELMIPYGIRTIQEISKQFGIPKLDPSQMMAIVQGNLQWLSDMGIPLTSIPQNVRDVCMLFARCSAVAACKQLGIPPEIGTATVDALSDGEFTASDVESIGGVAGGMGGSFVCGLIGIPPQVGGYLGSIAGRAIGGVASDLLGIGGGSAERERQRRERERARAAVRKQLESIRAQYQGMVPLVRSLYWSMFDHILGDLENFWEMTECATGIPGVLDPIRFPLAWGTNGLSANLSPTADPFLRHGFSAPNCPPPKYTLMRDSGKCLLPGYLTPGNAAGCPSMFGCPYPTFPAIGAGGAERVAQAFAAYNILWIQSPNREQNTRAWQDSLPVPPANIVNFIARRSAERQGCKSSTCRSYADRDIAHAVETYNGMLGQALEGAGPNPVLETGMRIQADIVGTGSVYAAAAQLRSQKNAIRSGRMTSVRAAISRLGDPGAIRALERNVTLSKVYGATANGLLNYGLPALGAVLLGKAILKR